MARKSKRSLALMRRLDPLVKRMYRDYCRGLSLAEVAEKYGRVGKNGQNTVFHLFKVRGLRCRKKHLPASYERGGATHRAKLDARVAKMHADYRQPMSLAAVGRKYRLDRRGVSELFIRRGLAVRPIAYKLRRLPNGQIEPAKPLTATEISALIAKAKRICIPDQLRHEWRKWSLQRRGEFIARLRAKINRIDDRPDLPFSSNVESFDYSSAHAHAIARRMNAGRDSRHAAVSIRLVSQGVIYREKLYFWAAEGGPGCGAYYIGPWRPGTGRPALHHIIWAEHNGQPVPEGHVIRHADGNRNNFEPANLILATKNDVARENHAAGFAAKSRNITALLLNRSQQKETPDEYTNTIAALSRVAR